MYRFTSQKNPLYYVAQHTKFRKFAGITRTCQTTYWLADNLIGQLQKAILRETPIFGLNCEILLRTNTSS